MEETQCSEWYDQTAMATAVLYCTRMHVRVMGELLGFAGMIVAWHRIVLLPHPHFFDGHNSELWLCFVFFFFLIHCAYFLPASLSSLNVMLTFHTHPSLLPRALSLSPSPRCLYQYIRSAVVERQLFLAPSRLSSLLSFLFFSSFLFAKLTSTPR